MREVPVQGSALAPSFGLADAIRGLSLACVRPGLLDGLRQEAGVTPGRAHTATVAPARLDGPVPIELVRAAAAGMKPEQFPILALAFRHGLSRDDLARILALDGAATAVALECARRAFLQEILVRLAREDSVTSAAVQGPRAARPPAIWTGAFRLVPIVRRRFERNAAERAGPLRQFAELPLIPAPPGLKAQILDRICASLLRGPPSRGPVGDGAVLRPVAPDGYG